LLRPPVHDVRQLAGFMSFLTERNSPKALLAANENALRESETRFRELADNISQFAWVADAKGWIYWYNRRWHDYTGKTLEEMEGWDWQKVHHPEHVDRVVQRIRQSFETGTPWEDTFPLRSKDGNYRWFLSRALPIRNEAGDVIRWFGTNTDVTEQIEAENALRESEEELRNARDAAEAALQDLRETQASLIEAEKFAALGRLVSGIAHEINNPVGICLTVASTLERKSVLFGAEVARGDVKRSSLNDFLETSRDGSVQLVTNLNRVAELIRSFKQIADDRISSDQRIFDLGDLTGQVLTSLRPSLRGRNVRLDVECQPNLTINSYPGGCGQLLTILLLNSLMHAFPDGKDGTVAIKVRASGQDNVEILFSDDGCGMSAEVRRQAFEPFFTTRHHLGSTGLGLHILHNIVTNRLGGRLNLESSPGAGTQFQIILPRFR
jgi:PAS domain S-box-containing protein